MLIRHDEIITKLTQLKIDGKDVRVSKNIYWEQTAATRVDRKINSFQIRHSFRQGCASAPDVFSHYNERILRNLEGYPGI